MVHKIGGIMYNTPEGTDRYFSKYEEDDRCGQIVTEEAYEQLKYMTSEDIAETLWGNDAKKELWEFILYGTQENIANEDDGTYGGICAAVVTSLTEAHIRNRLIRCYEEEIIEKIATSINTC
jgi:hypothetical protein